VVALDPTTEPDVRPPLVLQFDGAGEILWDSELTEANVDEDLQWTVPLIADDGIIIQTTDALYRLDWETGIQEWRSPFGEADVETFGLTGTIYSEGHVDAADPAGEILALDALTGEVLLDIGVPRGPHITGVARGWLMYNDPLSVNGVRVGSGETWNFDLAETSAAIVGERVIVVSPTTVASLEPDGTVISRVGTSGGLPQLPPIPLRKTVIVPGWEGTKAIDLDTGQVANEWRGSFYSPSYILDEDHALVGVAGDGIYFVESQ
jgi:outer membrane protein assembly factor BamB